MPDEPEVQGLLDLMGVVCDQSAYEELVDTSMLYTPNFEKRRVVLHMLGFSKVDLMTLLQPFCQHIRLHVLEPLLKQLVDRSCLHDANYGEGDKFIRYTWNPKVIAQYKSRDLLDNILSSRASIVRKYRPSVVALEVLKDAQLRIGTGFYVLDSNRRPFIVTAKHNIDPAERIEFQQIVGDDAHQMFAIIGDWLMHSSRDIGAARVVMNGKISPLYLSAGAEVLDETISLGYPKVSTSDCPYLLAHRGELNAEITSYLDKQKYLLISNAVAPGNSGGPVLNSIGEVIGVVVRSFESQYDDGTTQMSAAIPASVVREFIESL